MVVLVTAELKQYFSNTFDEISKVESHEFHYLTREYVINLLLSFANAKQIELSTLFSLYKNASNLSGNQQSFAYKRLGDTALFVGGFFNEYIENSTVNVDYYVDMGATAYDRVSVLTRSMMFQDLSQNFSIIVNVLSHMSDHMMFKTLKIEYLLERYYRNPFSKILLDKLAAKHAIPIFNKMEASD